MNNQSVHIDKKDVASHFFLHIGLLLCVFYPFKGLLNVAIYWLFGAEGFADYINPGTAFSIMVFVLLSFSAHARWSHFSKLDIYLCALGVILLAVSIGRRDFSYSQVVTLVLIMPVWFAHMVYCSDILFRRAVTIFFFVTALYIAVEHIVLHSHIYGLTDKIVVSSQELTRYHSLLAMGLDIQSIDPSEIVNDYRHTSFYEGMAGRARTGGFVANPLKMATLISMASTFFYIWCRRSPSLYLLISLALSLFGLFNSLSTAAVLAFVFCVMFYEFVYGSGFRKYIVLSITSVVFVMLVAYTELFFYLYTRLLTRLDLYIAIFGITSPSMASWQEYPITILIGQQGWLNERNSLYSENDILNVVTAFGLVVAYFIFKRLIQPALLSRQVENDELVVYAMVVLNAFFSMIHREAVFSPNTFILVTLLNVKTYRMLREYSRPGI